MNVHAAFSGGAVSTSPVTVKRVQSAAERRAFLDLPYRAYRDLPAWRAPP